MGDDKCMYDGCRKGPASGEKKCHALNTSEGYISGLVKPLSIRAFGVRARKLGGCMIIALLTNSF